MKTDRIYPELVHGANICAKLKHVFFPEQKWTESISHDIAAKLAAIKKKAKEFFGCASEIEALQKIDAMPLIDLQELCEVTFNGK